MTDIKLLSLPDWCLDDDRAAYVLEGMHGQQFRDAMQAYARVCVEANTEALRAEVTRLGGEIDVRNRRLQAKTTELKEVKRRIHGMDDTTAAAVRIADEANDRAERLAEALRDLPAKWRSDTAKDGDKYWGEFTTERYHCRGLADAYKVCADELEAALRDHDQEVGND